MSNKLVLRFCSTNPLPKWQWIRKKLMVSLRAKPYAAGTCRGERNVSRRRSNMWRNFERSNGTFSSISNTVGLTSTAEPLKGRNWRTLLGLGETDHWNLNPSTLEKWLSEEIEQNSYKPVGIPFLPIVAVEFEGGRDCCCCGATYCWHRMPALLGPQWPRDTLCGWLSK